MQKPGETGISGKSPYQLFLAIFCHKIQEEVIGEESENVKEVVIGCIGSMSGEGTKRLREKGRVAEVVVWFAKLHSTTD
ncbi:hypothetical protein [Thermococcus sp.]